MVITGSDPPDLMVDVFPSETRSRIMSRIRAKDTKPEIAVGRILWANGIRYRKHAKSVPGTPDMSNRSRRLAVFVDGCFWHGCPRCYREPSTNTSFWREKIRRNQERRKRVRTELRRMGFCVVEIWEHDTGSPERVMGRVRTAMRRSGRTGRVS